MSMTQHMPVDIRKLDPNSNLYEPPPEPTTEEIFEKLISYTNKLIESTGKKKKKTKLKHDISIVNDFLNKDIGVTPPKTSKNLQATLESLEKKLADLRLENEKEQVNEEEVLAADEPVES